MLNKKIFLTICTVAGLTLFAQSASAKMFDKDDFTPEQLASIKISMSDALAKAKAVEPGTPIKVEMENEDKTIVYEIEILNKDKEKKVKINAVTGEVVTGAK